MALVLADRVQQTGTANTTVSFTLSANVTGYQSFAVIGNTNTTYYAATDLTGNWEVGIGTYSTTGPTLTRTTILASSNSGSAVTFSGTVTVFVTYPVRSRSTKTQAVTSLTQEPSRGLWWHQATVCWSTAGRYQAHTPSARATTDSLLARSRSTRGRHLQSPLVNATLSFKGLR